MGRVFGFVDAIATLAIGMYIYSLQVRAIDPSAAAASGAEQPTIAGVKNDLIAIANAERGYMASEGKYASLDELVSGNYLTIKRERPPYVYDVESFFRQLSSHCHSYHQRRPRAALDHRNHAGREFGLTTLDE